MTTPATTVAPLRTLLLVRLTPLPEKVGHIITPNRQETAREATILAVGPECEDMVVGGRVLVTMLTGHQVGDDLLIPVASVLAYLLDA